jgi:broad specificity phosphatase PhoE
MEDHAARRLVLIRHGPSAHVSRRGAIDRAGVLAWRDAYNSAGILTDAQPPQALRELASIADYVIASDLRRAIESAERLVPQREIRVTDLLRETPLVIPDWPTRLPMLGWAIVIHLAWSYGIARGADATDADRNRAIAAAEWLTNLVSNGSTAVVVTHGVFRRSLASQLVDCGWTNTNRQGGYSHWSAWSFVRATHPENRQGEATR